MYQNAHNFITAISEQGEGLLVTEITQWTEKHTPMTKYTENFEEDPYNRRSIEKIYKNLGLVLDF